MRIEIGILITSCRAHKRRMQQTLSPYRKLKRYPVIIGHDDKKFDGESYGAKVFTTNGLGKRKGEHKQILIGSKMLLEMNCEYVFKTCADVLVTRPLEIPELIHKLRDCHFLCNQWDVKKQYFGTQIFFGETKLLVEVAEEIDKIIEKSVNCIEVDYGNAIHQLGYEYKVMDDIDQKDSGRLWKDELGCQHLR